LLSSGRGSFDILSQDRAPAASMPLVVEHDAAFELRKNKTACIRYFADVVPVAAQPAIFRFLTSPLHDSCRRLPSAGGQHEKAGGL